MRELWTADEDIRSLKSLILFGIRGMAAYAHHAMVLGYEDEELNRFFARALFTVGEISTWSSSCPSSSKSGNTTSAVWPCSTAPIPKPTATPFPPSSR